MEQTFSEKSFDGKDPEFEEKLLEKVLSKWADKGYDRNDGKIRLVVSLAIHETKLASHLSTAKAIFDELEKILDEELVHDIHLVIFKRCKALKAKHLAKEPKEDTSLSEESLEGKKED